MGYVFYDTETSGLDTSFSQILQFAAIHTDFEFNEIERYEIKCRILPVCVPSPGAMKVTGVPISRLTDKALPSSYTMISEIRKKLLSWSPAIFIGYNSLKFDEHILRHEFYKNLFPAYLTNTNKNSRLDALRLLQIASVLEPSSIKIPLGKDGRPSFKLDQVAPVNGFNHEHAHDALSDVEATIYLCRLISETSPEAWSNVMRFSQKATVRDFLDSEDIFCLYEVYFGTPYFYFVSSLGICPEKPGESYVFDLKADPAALESIDDEKLLKLISRSPKPVRRFKANSCPRLFPLDGLPEHVELTDSDRDTFSARAKYLSTNPELQKRLIRCYEDAQSEEKTLSHLETRLYESFFCEEDVKKMEQFHQLAWEDKYAHVQSFDDERLRELGARIIYFEKKHLLPLEDVQRLDVLFAKRIMSPDRELPWTTLTAANEEWENLSVTCDLDLVDGHKKYLGSMQKWAAEVMTVAAAV